jgi:hypothetical protein
MTSRLLLAAFATALRAFSQAPTNDSCGSTIGLQQGVNPQAPVGVSGQTFTNVGATNTPAPAPLGCAPFNKDVWFHYVPIVSGPTTFSTCTPAGFAAGTLADTTIAVYAAGVCGAPTTPIACDDDGCAGTLRSTVVATLTSNNAYYVRVGSFSATASGTFYLTVTESPTANGDVCWSSDGVSVGAWTNSTFVGCPLGAPSPCGTQGMVQRWFRFNALPAAGMTLSVEFAGAATAVDVYEDFGLCTGLNPIACVGGPIQIPVTPSMNYAFRFLMPDVAVPTTLDFQYRVLYLAAPPNDACANAFVVGDGVYPRHPGDLPFFTNAGALNSPNAPSCAGSDRSDVFFQYVATTSGKLSVSTATPPGKTPGTLLDPVLFATTSCGGSVLICNDDVDPTSKQSEIVFDAIQGQTYLLRVAAMGDAFDGGTFYLTIKTKFSLTMSSPTGFGSFRLRDENGAPGNAVYNCLTLQQGLYPNGPFFGIEPTFAEIAIQIGYGQAPFIAPLDGAGAYQYDHVGLLPPLVVYGVALQFDAAGQIAGVSAPTSHQIF